MADITTNTLKIGDNNLILRDADAQAKLTTNTQKIATLEADTSSLKDDKADIDGYYQDMTVGDAEQLVASQYVDDSVPYQFRTTGGSTDVGNREYVDAVVGGTVVWNQVVINGDFTNLNTNWSTRYATLSVSGGVATFVPSSDGTERGILQSGTSLSVVPGHKYLISVEINPSVAIAFSLSFGGGSGKVTPTLTANEWTQCGAVWTYDSTIGANVAIYSQGTMTTAQSVQIRNVFAIDLTQMFGSTIADYIYSLEQATAGAGVAWFKKLFPKDYYEYNAGELLSVSGLASHDMVGFNQWDEEWEVGLISISNGQNVTGQGIRSKNMCKCFPNTQYHVNFNSGGSKYIFWYDVDGNYIYQNPVDAEQTFTSPNNARYFKIRVDTIINYNHDICINLSRSGWRNGEYEAYEKHSYPLDDSLTLRGIPKLDASNNLYYDGDEYLPDGTVQRRYGVVDLGTLNWIYFDFEGHRRFGSNLEPVNYAPPTSNKANAMCDRYEVFTHSEIFNNEKIGIVIHNDGTQIQVYDPTYTDIASFKTAMSGVLLVYELATPTTENAEPYQHVQICDDFGTEEYVSTSIVPVGHNTRYPANLRDKLQHLPDLADDDGYYMIGQSNKQMHLELFRIPKAPTSPDGTYVLKATVSGGTPTYTWEAQT